MTLPQLDYVAIGNTVVTAVVTLAAAYYGAKYAFKLQNRKELSLIERANLEAANLAQFGLIRQHNFYLNVKSQLLGQFENNENRHHFIKPLTAIAIAPPSFDYSSLSFLFATDANLLFELAVLEQDLGGTLTIIKERSALHAEYLQPAVEQLHASSQSEMVAVGRVEEVMGMRRTMELRAATDYMVEGINRAIAETGKMSGRLRAAVKKVYPNASIVSIKPSEPQPAGT